MELFSHMFGLSYRIFFFRFESIVMHVHILYGFKIKHLFAVESWIKTDVPDVSVTLFTSKHHMYFNSSHRCLFNFNLTTKNLNVLKHV